MGFDGAASGIAGDGGVQRAGRLHGQRKADQREIFSACINVEGRAGGLHTDIKPSFSGHKAADTHFIQRAAHAELHGIKRCRGIGHPHPLVEGRVGAGRGSARLLRHQGEAAGYRQPRHRHLLRLQAVCADDPVKLLHRFH
ncbi:hypothetical protein SDC9_174765 [bioreactor metagenome]|uniref:Uncharacterized protein n=1 Tax=bioreactor metagenome TaxID=1076179 RepID=A0A645GTI1_9ZZZZ